jgi:hypothetical protein
MNRYCPCQQWDGSFIPCPKPWCEPYDDTAEPPNNHPDAAEQDLSDCPYFAGTGDQKCNHGCRWEPACVEQREGASRQ